MLVQKNDFVLLEVEPDKYFALRVVDSKNITMQYVPSVEIEGFLPLAPFGSPAVSGVFNSYAISSVELEMQEYSGIKNLISDTALDIAKSRKIVEITFGIYPSPLRIFKYYPSNVKLDNLTPTLGWGGNKSQYNFGYIDGYVSPYKHPNPDTSFYLLPQDSYQFAMENPTTNPITPMLNISFNILDMRPVDSILAYKMLNRIVPSKIISVGTFENGFKFTENNWGVYPLSLSSSEEQIKQGGY